MKSVKALTLLYDGEISEDIIPASSALLGDPVEDTQLTEGGNLENVENAENAENVENVENAENVEETVKTAPVSASGEAVGTASGEGGVVSGENSEQIQQLSDQVSYYNFNKTGYQPQSLADSSVSFSSFYFRIFIEALKLSFRWLFGPFCCDCN